MFRVFPLPVDKLDSVKESKKPIETPEEIQGHDLQVTHGYLYNDNFVISTGKDGYIQVRKDKKLIKKFRSHSFALLIFIILLRERFYLLVEMMVHFLLLDSILMLNYLNLIKLLIYLIKLLKLLKLLNHWKIHFVLILLLMFMINIKI